MIVKLTTPSRLRLDSVQRLQGITMQRPTTDTPIAQSISKQVRAIILQQSRRANVGHIGSCLCVVEILCALYNGVLQIPSISDPDRDRFILSKGHSALALYAIL